MLVPNAQRAQSVAVGVGHSKLATGASNCVIPVIAGSAVPYYKYIRGEEYVWAPAT